MPKLSGLEVLRALRGDEATRADEGPHPLQLFTRAGHRRGQQPRDLRLLREIEPVASGARASWSAACWRARVPEGARRVLLAEDDRFLRRAAEARLRRHGLEVLTAVDGEEALRIARAERLDLVLLDVVMPKLEGFEVLKLLKEDEATASHPGHRPVESRSGARRRSGQSARRRRVPRQGAPVAAGSRGSGGRRARDGDDLARR